MIDGYIEDLMQDKHLPGMSVGVVKSGATLLMKGYGMANLEHSVPATESTVYEVASVGKTFTAMVVMMLVETGSIALDDAIADYLPIPAAWRWVNIRHILSHQSGIPSYTEAENYWDITHLDLSKAEIIALVEDLPLKFQPGEQMSYDNTGYYLLGMMLEQVTGKSYADLMHERLFEPLGMNSTQMNNPEEIIPHRASGYRLLAKNKLINKPYYSPSMTYSAGGQLSSIEDMVKYEQELCCPTLIKQATLDLMWTCVKQSNLGSIWTSNLPQHHESCQQQGYVTGLGWMIPNYQNKRIIGHNGSIMGFASNITRFIDDEITIILFCNTDTIIRPDKIALKIAGYYSCELAKLSIQPPIS